jgi:quercetin dioxygenase-like cupin family protein
MRSALRVSVFAALLPLVATQVRAQQPALAWGPAPAVFPAGTKIAVLQGDPGKPGTFTVRLDFPDGTRLAPHFHPTEEAVTVISGTFLFGMGDSIDTAHLTAMPVGGFGVIPAEMHHYAIARGHTIVQVSAMGPFALTYVHASDNPANAATR